jgi:hypothetical protein
MRAKACFADAFSIGLRCKGGVEPPHSIEVCDAGWRRSKAECALPVAWALS